MALNAGTRLGTYEIVALIGAGGMGEVYRARDTRLKRDVAIKVLPDAFANDSERLARFQREAELLATLNHPNIAQIYGLEDRALVLELVEGPTLAERIAKGPLPLEEALSIAKQIADALEVAHERGIIHRDLKPANIKLTPDGKVKVLDFGLAKLAEPDSAFGFQATSMSRSPTITSPAMTLGGVILGTAAYMSPEQAKGLPADHRSDIFAFGVVLCEMLTGRRPFQGETAPEVLASVMVRDPDLQTLPSNLSQRLVELIHRCLEKNPKRRWQAIGDVAAEIERVSAAPYAAANSPLESQTRTWRRALPFVAVAGIAAAAAGTTAWQVKPAPSSTVASLSIALGRERLPIAGRRLLAISPDGHNVAYVADQRIFIRSIADFNPAAIPGTELQQGVLEPTFSPDGRHIVFWSQMDRTLKRIPVTGGSPVTVCEAGPPNGISWSGDRIMFAGISGILRVVAAGGKPEVIVPVKSGEMMQGPQVLPNGKYVLFSVTTGGIGWDEAKIVVESLDSHERTVLVEGGSDAQYLPTGHLVYGTRGALFAVPFDLDSLEVRGAPVSVVPDVSRTMTTGTSHFGVSSTGTLSYLRGAIEEPSGTLVTRKRDGTDIRALGAEPSSYPRYPRVSPKGDRLAVTLGPGQNGDVWVFDMREGQRPVKLTSQGHDLLPVWTPDGTRIVFRSVRANGIGLWSIASDGSESAAKPVTLNLEEPDRGALYPLDFSPDGRLLFSATRSKTRSDLFLTSIEATTADTRAWLETEFAEQAARFSPDKRLVAYVSDSTQEAEIWIRPFPGPGAPVRVSQGGGREPTWSSDGRELYFQAGSKMMAVRVLATSPVVQLGAQRELFSGGFMPYLINVPRTYDVSPEGRFVMIQLEGDVEPRTDIAVVLNWFEELKRLTPVN